MMFGTALQRVLVVTADDLDDSLDRMLLVAGIDAFRRVAEVELAELEPGLALEDWEAVVLGDAGIHGALVHDHHAFFQDLADGL
jgi:hypothetical protein